MNTKAKVFKKYLKEKEIKVFQVEELPEDEHNTVVFSSHIVVEGQQLPTLVILDDSAFSVIRVLILNNALTQDNEMKVMYMANTQNMNYKLATGQRRTSREQRLPGGMEQMQAPLAHATVLHRGAHQNVLEALGVQNYYNMSQSQLQRALVGREWTTKSLSSTSYSKSKSPFLSGPLAGGREVVMKINAAKGTMATRVNPSQAEVVIGRNTNWRVTGVRYTGSSAYPRGAGRSFPVVELEIDVW